MTAVVVHRLIVAWTVVQLVGLSLVVGYGCGLWWLSSPVYRLATVGFEAMR